MEKEPQRLLFGILRDDVREGTQEAVFLVSCALTLADFISTKSKVFLSFRTGPKRTLGPGPLRNLPAPEDEEGGPSPPLDSTLPRNVRTSAIRYRCSMGFGPTADGTSSITPIVS